MRVRLDAGAQPFVVGGGGHAEAAALAVTMCNTPKGIAATPTLAGAIPRPRSVGFAILVSSRRSGAPGGTEATEGALRTPTDDGAARGAGGGDAATAESRGSASAMIVASAEVTSSQVDARRLRVPPSASTVPM